MIGLGERFGLDCGKPHRALTDSHFKIDCYERMKVHKLQGHDIEIIPEDVFYDMISA